jgi:hypothetical protein
MRKLNKKAIISFNIFGLLVLLNIGMFALAVVKVAAASGVTYAVAADSVIFDKNNIPITTTANGEISKKWDGNFHLKLEKQGDFNLGKSTAAYETMSSKLKIYGDGYQVFYDGSVNRISKETQITDLSKTAFYKLADRKYLITGPLIKSNDGLMNAKKFLFVIVDKAGNAQLLNNTLNMKTAQPMVLLCGDIKFDIANEKLLVVQKTIDLTKIYGTTNKYSPAAKEEKNEPVKDLVIRGGKGGEGGKGGTGGLGGVGGFGGIGGLGGVGGSGGGSDLPAVAGRGEGVPVPVEERHAEGFCGAWSRGDRAGGTATGQPAGRIGGSAPAGDPGAGSATSRCSQTTSEKTSRAGSSSEARTTASI